MFFFPVSDLLLSLPSFSEPEGLQRRILRWRRLCTLLLLLLGGLPVSRGQRAGRERERERLSERRRRR
eukprot:5981945-Pyramimonas_sp.AAC.1